MKFRSIVPSPSPHAMDFRAAFGGPDLKTLYITAGGTLWSIRVNTPGRITYPAKQ